MDLHKAFDSISWEFIMAALTRLNFPPKFRKWIFACISTARYSVKVNGALVDYFSGAKGLRQRDPMSPYLFTIGMNILLCLLARHNSNLKHHWKCKGLKLTHLFFANDVLLFFHVDINSIKHIMHCLSLFSSISGLHPSIHKSTIFLSNCNTYVTNWFDTTYRVPHGSILVKFVGVTHISSK